VSRYRTYFSDTPFTGRVSAYTPLYDATEVRDWSLVLWLASDPEADHRVDGRDAY
jgi:hypothetical protein